FNNMLTVIKGASGQLARRLRTADPAVTRLLEALDQGTDRAAGLTSRLLAFSRRQALDPKAVAPNRLIAGLTDLLRRGVGERGSLETVLAPGLWRVSIDANQLENALLTLAINARDAMPEGGSLTIETANAYLGEGGAAAGEAVKAGQYVMIAA